MSAAAACHFWKHTNYCCDNRFFGDLRMMASTAPPPLENEKHKDNLVMSSKKDMAVKVCRILTMAHETTKECTLNQ